MATDIGSGRHKKNEGNQLPGAKKNMSGNPSEMEDGRYNEWQDRARVNLERADPSQSTNVERDYEPEDDYRVDDKDKFY